MFMGISLSKYLQIESNTGVEITPIQEENKGLRSEVQVRQESLDFQDETYDKKWKKHIEEKEKLEADYRKNEEKQKLV